MIKNWQNILTFSKVTLGLGLLYLTVREIKWDQFYQVLLRLDYVWLSITILTALLSIFLKIYRWAILLKNYQIDSSLIKISGSFLLSQATNILLPIRSGEIVRVTWLRLQRKDGILRIASSIFLEKYFDLLMLMIIFIVIIVFLPNYPIAFKSTSLIITGIILSITFLTLVWIGPKFWKKIRNKKIFEQQRWFHTLTEILDNLFEDSLLLRRPGQIIIICIITVCIWIIMLFTNIFLMKSLFLPIDTNASLLVLALVYIGVLPALMPGNIGPFYFFVNLGLSFTNYPISEKLAYAFLLHAIVTLIPLFFAGLFLLFDQKK